MSLLGVILLGGAASASAAAPARPQGVCDIYGAAGTPCVAAHSTTRALYAAYKGPLYQLKRQSDSKTLDIGVAAGTTGYADSAAQDVFCANVICVINRIYDQSGKGNHLLQAPPGTFFGPEKGGFNTQPIADMAPVTLGGHKVYGVYIMPGMGFRNNNATGIAVGDEPEGIYYVIDGKHFDSGCCFDYGNSSTNGRAVGTGTMETTYFGTSTAWGSGAGPGPWLMSDMEAGLFSGYNARQNTADPTVDSWRFVTEVVDGGGGNKWDLRGGNAQSGPLTTYYSGVRPGTPGSGAYYPMHKQGGILLGTGGDNGNGSSGTFYEGVMTSGYPTEATTDAVQANIVAAHYDVAHVGVSAVSTFTHKSTQDVAATFVNTSSAPANGVKLTLAAPAGWTVAPGQKNLATVAPGGTVSATFKVTSPAASGAGVLSARAEWASGATRLNEVATRRIRSIVPVKINEVRFANQFIELYNASSTPVDLSHWTIVSTQTQWAPITLASIPAGTRIDPGSFYLLGLAGSGLVAPAAPGASVINVRSVAGMDAGRKIDIDGESRTIANLGAAASPMTLVFIPVSTGPRISFPAGTTNLPVANAAGFTAGQKIGIDAGGNHEIVTATSVGKAATQTTLAASVKSGAKNIKLAADANVTEGDTLTIGTGALKELVKVATVGAPGAAGSGIDLATPLKFDHNEGVDVSDPGTGITFAPATRFAHESGDAIQALGSGITLDRPLEKAHTYGAPILGAQTEGYRDAVAPKQWFGGMLSDRGGSIALRDANGAVMDAIVYGSQQSNSSGNGTIASPELATLGSEQGKGGCIVVPPPAAAGVGRSRGRFPDGADTGSLCTDFHTQPATTLALPAVAGATAIKVASVADFAAGQKIALDTDAGAEIGVIATVGTSGGTTVRAASAAGATTIPVASAMGFVAGQTISIDSGANADTATVASVAGGGRGGMAVINLTTAIAHAHAAGAQVSGTGITLSVPLAKPHATGALVEVGGPTPGAPNQYSEARR